MGRVVSVCAFGALLALGCIEGERVGGNVPQGGQTVSRVSAEAYLRRAFADLHGLVPAPSEPRWTEPLAALTAARMSPFTRRVVAERLVADPRYAEAFVEEHAAPLLGLGGGVEGNYRFLATYFDELLAMTSDSAEREALEAYRRLLDAELEGLRALPRGLAAREIDEADAIALIANSTAAAILAGPDAYARSLFRELLAREPGIHEARNAAAMALPAQFVGGDDAPVAGNVLRRDGAHLPDLARILVSSDAFLDARVRAVFARLLGRAPKPGELWAAFDALRDARRAGHFGQAYRALVTTVLSSDEYSRP